jgi:hypothetical protein
MRASALGIIIVLNACTTPATNAPSLAPRAAESIDPRLPIGNAAPIRPPSAALVSRLNALVEQAKSGDFTFQTAAAEAERLAAAAGDQQSESWVVAQQALSVAVAAREPVTKALGDIDAIGSNRLATSGAMAAADQEAMTAAAVTVGEIDRRQAAVIDRIQRRLGG